MPAVNNASTEEELREVLSRPYAEDIELAERLRGDVIVLGAGGKMGPTLVQRLMRALREAKNSLNVYAVSRYSDEESRREIEATGAEVVGADIMIGRELQSLPDCPNVIYLVGMKFGASGRQAKTWAVNTYLPGRVAERFPDARIVALSTGNVYPLVPVDSKGSVERDEPGPLGEYAQSCLGRERVLQHFSLQNGTAVCLIRLNYAVEARYGVLLDIATRVFRGEPVSIEMGFVNIIWQGDANSYTLRALEQCKSPAEVLNVTGPDVISVRALAQQFGERFGRPPRFSGAEAETALLSDASKCHALFGPPRVALDDVVELVAGWIERGAPTHEKPTKFGVRDGQF